MTQLSLDATNRLPLLDLAPISKPVRAANSHDEFDSHLNRASGVAESRTSDAAPVGKTTSPASSEPSRATESDEQPTESPLLASESDDEQDPSAAATETASQPEETDETVDKEPLEQTEEEIAAHESDVVVAVQQLVAHVEDIDEIPADSTDASELEGIDELTASDATKDKRPVAVQKTAATQPALAEGSKQPTSATPTSDGKSTEVLPATAEVATTIELVEPTEALPTTTQTESPKAAKGDVKPTPTATVQAEQPAVVSEATPAIVGETVSIEVSEVTSTDRPKSKAKTTVGEDNIETIARQAAPAEQAEKFPQEFKAAESLPVSGELAPAETAGGNDAAGNQTGSQSEQQPAASEAAATKPNRNEAAQATESPAVSKPISAVGDAPVMRAADASGTTAAAGSEHSTAVDRSRFVQRVYRALHVAHERGGEIRLRLSPPELGNLTLELKLQDGVMTAHIEAETPAARTLLLENVAMLKERLAEQDIQVERFDVDLMDRQPQQSPDDQSQNGDMRPRFHRLTSKPMNSGTAQNEDNTVRGTSVASGTGSLNVII